MNCPMASKDSRVNRIIIIVSLLVLIVVYSLFNPEECQIFPLCPFRQLTGLLCSDCGSQRAILISSTPTLNIQHVHLEYLTGGVLSTQDDSF